MKVPPWLIATPLHFAYSLWGTTLRWGGEGRNCGDKLMVHVPCILVCWHDELFPLAYLRGQLKIAGLISRSNDGEYLAQLMKKRKVKTVRGSSSRGGSSALVALARCMEEGYCPTITVDGPKGPRHKAKNGALFLAQKTQRPIIPIRIFMDNAKIFHKAWDKFQLPLPFSKLHTATGAPIYVPPKEELSDEGFEAKRLEMEQALENLRPASFTK